MSRRRLRPFRLERRPERKSAMSGKRFEGGSIAGVNEYDDGEHPP